MENNGLEQMLTLRRYYLPDADDSEQSLARAVWLDNRYWEYFSISVANGIAKIF
ncbi:TPA: DUF6890 family protein [Escherichia coli]|uniref:DUF6890 family protein n=1 Tax=Escherichia coli TaxID=562 RepID=UPI000ACCBB43